MPELQHTILALKNAQCQGKATSKLLHPVRNKNLKHCTTARGQSKAYQKCALWIRKAQCQGKATSKLLHPVREQKTKTIKSAAQLPEASQKRAKKNTVPRQGNDAGGALINRLQWHRHLHEGWPKCRLNDNSGISFRVAHLKGTECAR